MIGRIAALLIGIVLFLQPSGAASVALAAKPSRDSGPTSPTPLAEQPRSVAVVSADGTVVRLLEHPSLSRAASAPNACTTPPPTLQSPVGDVLVDTLVPYFEWTNTGSRYRVQISRSSSFSPLIYDENWGTGGTYDPRIPLPFNLPASTTYYWRVASRCSDGSVGSFSSSASFLTGNVTGPFPGPPSMIAPVNGAVQSSLDVTFSWGDVSEATALQIRIYDSLGEAQGDDQWHDIPWIGGWARSWSTSTSWTVPSVGTYYWRVGAGDDSGWGSLSPVWSFTVGSAPGPKVYLPLIMR